MGCELFAKEDVATVDVDGLKDRITLECPVNLVYTPYQARKLIETLEAAVAACVLEAARKP